MAGSVEAVAATEYHSKIRDAQAAGFEPIGTSTVWVFPPFASAPQVPETKIGLFTKVPEARINCIPPFGTAEYRRLTEIRNSMWATLVKEFPEVQLLTVGDEPSFTFHDCNGQQLQLQDLFVFFVDTLEGARGAIKSQNSNAIVIAHFLGRTGTPIFIRGQLVQPREIIAGVQLEIARRGGAQGTFFDRWAFELDPDLSLDRYPEPSIPVSFGSVGTMVTSGWNTKYLEEFTVNTSNLVTTYADWENWRTTALIVPTAVSNGYAQLRLSTLQDPTIGGAITANTTPDVVPDQEFTEQYPERNKWTAVMDFLGVQNTTPPDAHASVFIRVLDRTWETLPDQTRFGSFVYGGLVSNEVCQNQYCGALQLSGDDITANPPQSKGKLKLLHFVLDPQSEHPWNNSSKLYRVEIKEREYWDVLKSEYDLQWRAEIYRVTPSGLLIGYSDWIWESTVVNVYGIAIPTPLASSKLAIGLGRGTGGGVDSALTGTAWWVY